MGGGGGGGRQGYQAITRISHHHNYWGLSEIFYKLSQIHEWDVICIPYVHSAFTFVRNTNVRYAPANTRTDTHLIANIFIISMYFYIPILIPLCEEQHPYLSFTEWAMERRCLDCRRAGWLLVCRTVAANGHMNRGRWRWAKQKCNTISNSSNALLNFDGEMNDEETGGNRLFRPSTSLKYRIDNKKQFVIITVYSQSAAINEMTCLLDWFTGHFR